ncbi:MULTISPECIES: YdeI/OmpD-associated family protein [unclassified Rhodanobacter]|uniref:YdeI/OmpD-associated family protein n=1 Tax=unclassified Rhodanobacter TaxID=2621553 RepID=UPI001BDEECCB|nr:MULTISPECIES: YdeI/OmpD-associated family protein [unclassified Rhodanobacter]MBT2142984.1 YdeI/OmpD-associated family protein [Rhodanobacter sp. LX-99]MBT2147943.1 YdeI/OmpD-associated family protein [Rhodanobacter sp. LX-100]
MANHDPRIDAYIAKSAGFARPILEHLRARVHEACPEVEESLKWSMPFFSYKDAPMCMMAAFKQHCSFGFWLSKEVTGGSDEEGMGQFGKLATLKDLPSDRQLAAHLKKAMALNEAGVKKARPKAAAKPAPALPDDLSVLLAKRQHAAARQAWASFPPGAQREYVDWIAEAKTDATRQKRLATTLEWLAEGKRRHWKYEKC